MTEGGEAVNRKICSDGARLKVGKYLKKKATVSEPEAKGQGIKLKQVFFAPLSGAFLFNKNALQDAHDAIRQFLPLCGIAAAREVAGPLRLRGRGAEVGWPA